MAFCELQVLKEPHTGQGGAKVQPEFRLWFSFVSLNHEDIVFFKHQERIKMSSLLQFYC